MDFDKIKEFLNRIPFTMILFVYLLYLGYNTYEFLEGADSPLQEKIAEYKKEEIKVKDLEKKLTETKEFIKNLDVKRQTLRNLSVQLNETRASLSEDLDIPAFIKMVVTEAKKVGLTVLSIQPTEEKVQELYVEQRFEMQYRGVFVQLLVFLQRLASVQKIIRTDEIDIRPVSTSSSRFVEIQGKIILQTYRYSGNKADEVISKPSTEGTPP